MWRLVFLSGPCALVLLCGLGANQAVAKRGGTLVLKTVDAQTGQPMPCRIHLERVIPTPRKEKRVHQKVKGLPFFEDHFVCPGQVTLDLPNGNYQFEIQRGPEYPITSGHFRIETFADDSKTVELKRFVDMAKEGWWSGDLGVLRPVDQIERLMLAEDLHVATVLTSTNNPKWEKKTITGKKTGGLCPTGEFAPEPVCFHKNYYYSLASGLHFWPGTELAYHGLTAPLKRTPPQTNAVFFPLEIVGKANETPQTHIEAVDASVADLPLLIAEGQIDSIRLAGEQIGRDRLFKNKKERKPFDRKFFPPPFGRIHWNQQIYFHLLNCGLRIPPSAGSGSGIGPNPLGYNRMYVFVEGDFNYDAWWNAFRAGRVTITNGPLLRPSVEGQPPGALFRAEGKEPVELEIGLTFSTRQPISYLEIIKNGEIEQTIRFADYAKTGKLPKIRFERSGWFLLRAVTDLEKTYRFAMTGPYYVEFDYRPRISRQSVQFFLDWVDKRLEHFRELPTSPGQAKALAAYQKARSFWEDLLKKAERQQ